MPIIKSAKKRVRIAHKAAVRNAKTKRSLKTAVKTFRSKAGEKALRDVQSALDIAVKKGVIHKNKAARKKRQLAATAKAAGVKPVSKKKTAAKPAVQKKPVAAKKPAAKKPTKK